MLITKNILTFCLSWEVGPLLGAERVLTKLEEVGFLFHSDYIEKYSMGIQ